MKRLLLYLACALLATLMRAASVIPFAPIVEDYTVADYGAGIQNWSIAQDSRGAIYVANNQGLLEFDGSHWVLHALPRQGIVRSVYVDANDRVYVGSYEEFGYFERDERTRFRYHSLKSRVKDFQFRNDEIWNICEHEGDVVFQSFGSLFCYDGNEVVGLRQQMPLNLFVYDGVCYSQQIDGGVSVFKHRQLTTQIERPQTGNADVASIQPYTDGELLFFTTDRGVYHYNKVSGKVKPWKTSVDAELKKHSINRCVMTKDSIYVVGTIANGIYAIDRSGALLWQLNTEGQLRNNTVLGLYCDSKNNIWAALDEGVAFIRHSSPIYYYEPNSHKIGMVYDVLTHDGKAYIASNQGLYISEHGDTRLVAGLDGQAWFVDDVEGQIICGHNRGTFEIVGDRAVLLSIVKGGMCMRPITMDDGRECLLEGNYVELSLYENGADGKWRFSHAIPGMHQMVKSLEIDHLGNIWAEHLRRGLYRLNLTDDGKRVKIVGVYERMNDDVDGKYVVFKMNGRVVFVNRAGFFTYEDMTDQVVPYRAMNEQLGDLRDIHAVTPAGGNNYWMLNSRTAYLVNCNGNTFTVRNRIPFSIFNGVVTEERASVVFDKNSDSHYFCLNNAVACIPKPAQHREDTLVDYPLNIRACKVMGGVIV